MRIISRRLRKICPDCGILLYDEGDEVGWIHEYDEDKCPAQKVVE